MGKAFVVGLEDAPCGPIAISHAIELDKTLVGLFYRSTLPFVGRVSDVEWVVVSDSSCHSLCVSKINCHLPSVIVLLFYTKSTFPGKESTIPGRPVNLCSKQSQLIPNGNGIVNFVSKNRVNLF